MLRYKESKKSMDGRREKGKRRDIQNKTKRSRRKKNNGKYIIAAASVAAILSASLWLGRNWNRGQEREKELEAAALNTEASTLETEPVTVESTLSPEEQERQRVLREKKAVVDSYENLGLVQVAGYLNVREAPGSNGKIIGKLQQNSACEILDTEGEWCHVTSGGIEGYIHNRYVISGSQAREEAIAHVDKMAEVNTEKLNIRSEPVMVDASNVVAQALIHERYPVLEELDGWIRIEEGYISTDYVTVKYALNEARKLDLRTMALNQYDHLVISKVDSYLNIRSSPESGDDTNVIGKFPGKAAGEILETLDGWYKVKSGAITGYVTADPELVAVGQEARDLALESATLMAIVNTDRLNVRSEPTTSARIWTQISKEDRYSVLDQMDGWVQIELDGGDEDELSDGAYISTRDNNVEVRYALAEAIKFSPMAELANQQASQRSKIVNYALQFKGYPYVYGAAGPNSFDCSGFTSYVFKHFGYRLNRSSRDQLRNGVPVDKSQLQPADLLLFSRDGNTVSHVGLYIGNGKFIHASTSTTGVIISDLNSTYYTNHYYAARRII